MNSTVLRQKSRSLFVNDSGGPRPLFLVILYPLGTILILLMVAFVVVLAPLVIFVGMIGAACSWLDKVGSGR